MRTQALRNEQELFKQKGRKSGQQKLHEAEERENRRVMECESELGLESSPVELRHVFGKLGWWGVGRGREAAVHRYGLGTRTEYHVKHLNFWEAGVH